jgi:DNA-binding NarL/FixJ family response regulator
VRVILVDDAPLVREGIARLLAEEGVEVDAQLSDATTLLETVVRLEPNVVVMDVRMPPTYTCEGLCAAGELKRAHPQVGVLMLSQHLESRYAVDLLAASDAGVGYLLKERVARPAALVDAVRRVASGGTAIDPEVVSAVLHTRRAPDPLDWLTVRERDVLGLVAEGYSNDGVAARLVVNRRTIETHMANIFTKLGLGAEEGTHRRVLAVLAHLRAHSQYSPTSP